MSEKDHTDHPHHSYHAANDPRHDPAQSPTRVSRSGAARILEERHRQIYAEGFTPEHDAEHEPWELMEAAWSYLVQARQIMQMPNSTYADRPPVAWPFEPETWKPSQDPVRNLEKAGALIAAAIDRIEADL